MINIIITFSITVIITTTIVVTRTITMTARLLLRSLVQAPIELSAVDVVPPGPPGPLKYSISISIV